MGGEFDQVISLKLKVGQTFIASKQDGGVVIIINAKDETVLPSLLALHAGSKLHVSASFLGQNDPDLTTI